MKSGIASIHFQPGLRSGNSFHIDSQEGLLAPAADGAWINLGVEGPFSIGALGLIQTPVIAVRKPVSQGHKAAEPQHIHWQSLYGKAEPFRTSGGEAVLNER